MEDRAPAVQKPERPRLRAWGQHPITQIGTAPHSVLCPFSKLDVKSRSFDGHKWASGKKPCSHFRSEESYFGFGLHSLQHILRNLGSEQIMRQKYAQAEHTRATKRADPISETGPIDLCVIGS